MKTIRLFIAAATFLMASAAVAAPVTPQQALARIRADRSSAPGVLRASAPSTEGMKCIATLDQLYVFSNGKGFVVAPADDSAAPVLGYSEDGDFDTAGNPALNAWLGGYTRQIKFAASANAPTYEAVPQRVQRPAIAPLTTTLWNQNAPYNDLCPLDNGERSVTGCVATAMSQVMKYHNWPSKGNGTDSYSCLGQTLTFDYANTPFDWGNMTNTYSSSSSTAQKNAVATLMYACGVAVHMDYTSDESGASSVMMAQQLISRFNYNKGLRMLMRDFYGLAEWEDMVYADLAAGRPVLYDGQSGEGGHQFICDGYSTDDYFHFNWGWGGMSDGYFLLTALDPMTMGIGGSGAGFNYDQGAVIGLEPDNGTTAPAYFMACDGDFGTSASTVDHGGEVTFTGTFVNFSLSALPSGSKLGILINPGNRYIAGTDVSSMGSYEETTQFTVDMPATMADGTYTVTPVFRSGDNASWSTVRTPLSNAQTVTMTISNNVATFVSDDPVLTVTNLKILTDLYYDTDFEMSFTATNGNDREYYGGVMPVLFTMNNGEPVEAGVGEQYVVDLDPGVSTTVKYTTQFTVQSQDGTSGPVSPGTYYMALATTEGKMLTEPQSVTINEQEAQVEVQAYNLSVEGGTPVMYFGPREFTATVECVSGYYAGTPDIVIFPTSGGEDVAMVSTQELFLNTGSTGVIRGTIDLSTLKKGTEYVAEVYNGQSSISNPFYFTIDANAGIEILKVEKNADVIYYSVDGVKYKRPTKPGIYITSEGKKVAIK